MFQRETIIALRARHQAYRVASDVLYPDLQVAPPLPPTPYENGEPRPVPMSKEEIHAFLRARRRAERTVRYGIFAAYMIFFAGLIAYIVIWNLKHPSL